MYPEATIRGESGSEEGQARILVGEKGGKTKSAGDPHGGRQRNGKEEIEVRGRTDRKRFDFL